MQFIEGDYIALLVGVTLGLVFLVAGISKLRELASFSYTMRSYQILPDFLTEKLAPVLPVIEIILGISLLLGIALPVSAAASVLLLTVFVAAMLINILRGRKGIPCGCFGSLGGTKIGWVPVGRNAMLIAAGLFLIVQTVGSVSDLGEIIYYRALLEVAGLPKAVFAFMSATALLLVLTILEQVMSLVEHSDTYTGAKGSFTE